MSHTLCWAATPNAHEENSKAQGPRRSRDASLARLVQATMAGEEKWNNAAWALVALCAGVVLAVSLF